MRQVHSSPNVALINHYRSVLDSAGIPCIVRGEYLSAALGEIPPIEAWAELWVVDDHRFDDAKRLITELEAGTRDEAPWTCDACGEDNEATFAVCWSCGAPVERAARRAG